MTKQSGNARSATPRRDTARTSEAQLLADIRRDLGRERDLVLWRNNVGAVERQEFEESPGPFGVPVRTPKRGSSRLVRYGLGVGSSDLIGVLRVGGVGVFVALECKTTTGRTTPEQDLFLDLVRSRGGFAAVVRSVDEARAALDRARQGAHG